jgi:DNA-binding MarR family transcriptional regulator
MKDREGLLAELGQAIREVSGQGVLFSQAVASKVGINSTDLECLDILMLRGPVTPGALAASTGLTTGAMTVLIDRLEKAGFVRRERSRDDRRKVLVTATPAVTKEVVPYSVPMQTAVMAVLDHYSDADLRLLLEVLRACSVAASAAIAETRTMPARQELKSASAP